MALIVKKFGGSSVGSTEKIMNVAKRIIEEKKPGDQIVMVVSAMGDTTDDLIELAKGINSNPYQYSREMDMLLTTGEQVSISLLTMAFKSLGQKAISLTGPMVGMRTNSVHTKGKIVDIKPSRVRKELEKGKIVVVAGFQGADEKGDPVTLGRGGSDTSAVALAGALKADACEIYTDVDGVYSADPRIVKNAKKMESISYDEMLELASLGANVLHNRSVEMAKKYNVKLAVRSSFTENEGTYVREVKDMEKMMVKGVSRDNDVARIALIGLEDRPGVAFKIFSLLAKNKINVDIILQSIGRNGKKDISFTVSRGNMEKAAEILEAAEMLDFERIEHSTDVSKVSIVGAGMVNNPGVASKMFEALYDANINIHMISTSEIKISVLIDEKDAEKAVVAIHDKFNI